MYYCSAVPSLDCNCPVPTIYSHTEVAIISYIGWNKIGFSFDTSTSDHPEIIFIGVTQEWPSFVCW